MKKVILISALLVLLCSCEFLEEKIGNVLPKENSPENVEIKEEPEETIKKEEKKEPEKKETFANNFKFNSGESFKYNDFEILNNERIPFEISSEYKNSLTKTLQNLNKTEDENFEKNHADENTMMINFDDGREILFLIQSKSQNEKFYYKLISENKEIEGFYESDINIKDEIKTSMIEEYFLKETHENNNSIKVVDIDLIKEFSEGDKKVILANISHLDFSFEDEIFSMYGGEFFPVEIHFQNVDGKILLKDFLKAKDGSEFLKSVQQMSRNDQEIAAKLLASQNSYIYRFDSIMEKLKEKSEELKLKNYTHDIDKIPGYSENVIQFENDEGEPLGTVSIYKKSDFETQVDPLNPAPRFIEGILYHLKTQISLRNSKLLTK